MPSRHSWETVQGVPEEISWKVLSVLEDSEVNYLISQMLQQLLLLMLEEGGLQEVG